MVHTVEIIAYTPRSKVAGRLTFKLDGNTYHARCYAEPKLADGLLVVGTSYPVSLTLEAEGKVDYAAASAPKFEVLKKDESGDVVRATGRTWEPVEHQVIKLDAAPTVSVRLNLPQTATDYRGGSWLTAVGTLCADLPPEDHD
jgi:hypothetical protein